MKAVKGNKVYHVDEKSMKTYQDAGYDILENDGTVVAYGRGKTVPYGEYATLKEENKALKAEVEALKAELSAAAVSVKAKAKADK